MYVSVCIIIVSIIIIYFLLNHYSPKVYYPVDDYQKMNILQKHWNVIALEYKLFIISDSLNITCFFKSLSISLNLKISNSLTLLKTIFLVFDCSKDILIILKVLLSNLKEIF